MESRAAFDQDLRRCWRGPEELSNLLRDRQWSHPLDCGFRRRTLGVPNPSSPESDPDTNPEKSAASFQFNKVARSAMALRWFLAVPVCPLTPAADPSKLANLRREGRGAAGRQVREIP